MPSIADGPIRPVMASGKDANGLIKEFAALGSRQRGAKLKSAGIVWTTFSVLAMSAIGLQDTIIVTGLFVDVNTLSTGEGAAAHHSPLTAAQAMTVADVKDVRVEGTALPVDLPYGLTSCYSYTSSHNPRFDAISCTTLDGARLPARLLTGPENQAWKQRRRQSRAPTESQTVTDVTDLDGQSHSQSEVRRLPQAEGARFGSNSLGRVASVAAE